MDSCELLLTNARTIDSKGKPLENQSLAIAKGRILWCGASSELPSSYQQQAQIIENCQGRLLTPGLIDCHTHLVYAADRADEFKQGLEGRSYAEIAQAGG